MNLFTNFVFIEIKTKQNKTSKKNKKKTQNKNKKNKQRKLDMFMS